MSLYDDLAGLEGLRSCGLGVTVKCQSCSQRASGNTEHCVTEEDKHDCFSGTLWYIAVKLKKLKYVREDELEALGYVKVPEMRTCSRCGELPMLYPLKPSGIALVVGEGLSWACNCKHCGYGSLGAMRSIEAAINRWNEWNDEEQQGAYTDEQRKRRHEEAEREGTDGP